jgi:RNA polymerase sigma-70 factor (ECF subfamily)
MPDDFTESLVAALPPLRRFALSLARQPDMADDLVQLTVERALKARDRYDPSTPLEAWLFRILRNAFIDMTRRRRTRSIESDIDDMPEAASFDGRRDTEARLMLSQTLEAMRALSDDHRALLALVCIEEMSYAEAAETLGIPVGTVMSRLARARRALAQKLGIE